MADDLASNYSIRNWLRHNRRYPCEDTNQVQERLHCATFVVAIMVSLFAVFIAWVVITWPTMRELKGGAPRPLDAESLLVALKIVAMPFILCAVSWHKWRRLRRSRLNRS